MTLIINRHDKQTPTFDKIRQVSISFKNNKTLAFKNDLTTAMLRCNLILRQRNDTGDATMKDRQRRCYGGGMTSTMLRHGKDSGDVTTAIRSVHGCFWLDAAFKLATCSGGHNLVLLFDAPVRIYNGRIQNI